MSTARKLSESNPAMVPGPASAAMIRRQVWIALVLGLICSCLLAVLCAPVIASYFPYAEEWKILLPSWPGLANPAEWLLGFDRTLTNPYPAWAVASANFFRPVMNVVYWLRGAMFGENWGAQLYFNYLFIGAAAGALYLCLRTLRQDMLGFWLAVILVFAYLLMPPLVSADSRFQPILIPQFPFDRLVAALSLLSCLSYVYRRYLLAAILVFVALMAKEQALPLAAALPLTYAWVNRKHLRESMLPLLILAAPLLLWIAIRLLLFGSISQGVYVLMREPVDIVRGFLINLLKLPLYAPSLSGALRSPFSWGALLVACNGVVLAYLLFETWRRWRAYGPDVISVAVLLFWGFFALVGLNPRYGATIVALTILMVARPAAAGVPRMARAGALSAVLVTGAVHGMLSMHSFDTHVRFSQVIYEVGRDYAAALADAGTHDAEAVVVLNDPNTMYTAPSDMAKVLQLPVTAVHKASDFPWRWPAPFARSVPEQACEVAVERVGTDTVEMQQSCGFQIMGALVPYQKPPVLPVTEGVEAVFPQAEFNAKGRISDLGKRMVVRIQRPGVAIIYFDPETRSFHWLDRTAGAISASEEASTDG